MSPDGSADTNSPGSPLRFKKEEEVALRGADVEVDTAPPPAAVDTIEALALTARQRLIAGGLVMLLGLAAILVFLKAAIFSLIVALIAAAALAPAIVALDRRKIPPSHSAPALFAVFAAVLGLVLLLAAPAWQRQAEAYGAHLVELTAHLSGATRSLPDGPAPAGEPPADTNAAAGSNDAAVARGEAASNLTASAKMSPGEAQAVAAQSAGWLSRQAEAVVGAANGFTRAAVNRRVPFFIQLTLLLGCFLSLPLLIPHRQAAAEGAPQGVRHSVGALLAEGYFKVAGRVGLWFAGRLLKALILAGLAGLGFALAGLDTPVFLAGCLFVLGALLKWGSSFVMLLALAAVPFAPALPRALLALAVLWLVLVFAEYRMHWRLVLLPALRAGYVPPGGAHAGPRRAGGGLRLMRALISLALLAAVGALAWAILPRYFAERARITALNAAMDDYNAGSTERALKEYQQLATQYPQDRAVLLGLSKGYADLGQRELALTNAERVAQWQPQPPAERAWPDWVYNRVMRLVNRTPPPDYQAKDGYFYLLVQTLGDAPPDAFMKDLAMRLLAIDPSDPWGNLCLTRFCLGNKDDDHVIEYAKRGLQSLPADDHEVAPELWASLAEVYVVKRRWQDAAEACSKAVAGDPKLTPRIAPLKRAAELGLREGLR